MSTLTILALIEMFGESVRPPDEISDDVLAGRRADIRLFDGGEPSATTETDALGDTNKSYGYERPDRRTTRPGMRERVVRSVPLDWEGSVGWEGESVFCADACRTRAAPP